MSLPHLINAQADPFCPVLNHMIYLEASCILRPNPFFANDLKNDSRSSYVGGTRR